eukprot:366408-Chlamydomonas_euryale.AAC.4
MVMSLSLFELMQRQRAPLGPTAAWSRPPFETTWPQRARCIQLPPRVFYRASRAWMASGG